MTLISCPPWCVLAPGHDLGQAPDGDRYVRHEDELHIAITRTHLRTVQTVQLDVVTAGGEVVIGAPELELDGEADARMDLDETSDYTQAIVAAAAGARGSG